MSNAAIKKDLLDNGNFRDRDTRPDRDTIPDDEFPDIVVTDLNPQDAAALDLSLGDLEVPATIPQPEKSSIQIRQELATPQSVRDEIIGRAKAWLPSTMITNANPDTPEIAKFKTDLHQAISETYFYAAWEILSQRRSLLNTTRLEHTRDHAIEYLNQLLDKRYEEVMDKLTVQQMVFIVTIGDWHTPHGLLDVDKRIRGTLNLPPNNRSWIALPKDPKPL